MRVRFCGALCKLLQKQTYSFLSSRSGIVFCIAGTILFLVSLLQFGEVALEWSMEKYNVRLNSPFDSIGGSFFKGKVCLDEPIDIVYTWVNGSDPSLIQELKSVREEWKDAYKKRLKAQSPTKAKHLVKDTLKKQQEKPRDFNRWKGMWSCPLPNCAPFPAIAISNSSFSYLQSIESKFSRKNIIKYPSNDPSTVIVGFTTLKEAKLVITNTLQFCGAGCPNISIVFITSALKKGQKRLGRYGLLHDVNITVEEDEIINAFKLHSINVVSASVHEATNNSNTAVLQFQNEGYFRKATFVPRINLMIRREHKRVFSSGLVWQPISYLEEAGVSEFEDISSSRFADNEELRYSLRSVEKFAPWVRKIFIVTNGQIPSWLNLENRRIKVVTHKEIFQNISHLPTFSSPAIESHIHRIKGLSTQFIYMNDDVFFGRPVWPDDFHTIGRGQKVYLTWPVPNCNEGCPASWISDKYCDKACNVSECDYDGGDCINPQVLRWQSQTLQSLASVSTEFCNSACAHTWIGDRYCDAHCNVEDCGYDAGDCGLEKLRTIPSHMVTLDTKEAYFNDGVNSFYLNFTNIFQRGSLSEGDFGDHFIMRSAVYSRAYKILSVTLFANHSRQAIPFRLKGFLGKNQTEKVQLFFNISVCTVGKNKKLQDTTGARTLANEVQTELPSPYPRFIYNSSLHPNHLKEKPIYKHTDKYRDMNISLPDHVKQKLEIIKKEFLNGDITEKGYNLSKAMVVQDYLMDIERERKVNQVNLGRKLLAVEKIQNSEEDNNNELHSNTIDTIPKRKLIKIIAAPIKCSGHNVKNCKRNKNHKSFGVLTAKINAWKRRYGDWDPIRYPQQTSFLPWEKHNSFQDVSEMVKHQKMLERYQTLTFKKRKLLDTFADSLLHVSKIYNRAFGYKARKVPAHMPHMINRDVVYEMQKLFEPYFDLTSSHQIRSPQDMQFAFSYQYFIMGLPATLNMTSLFAELDTDKSGALSDRELRTLAARLYELPLDLRVTESFEAMIKNCSLDKTGSGQKEEAGRSTEYYYDPSMPLVTEQLLADCHPLVSKLNTSLKGKTKYKFEVLNDDDVAFKMIRNNLTNVLMQLDWIRKHKRKFICLNDNIDHLAPAAKTIRALVRDFFEAFFPVPSQFEISKGYRNRFLRVEELEKSMQDKEAARNQFYYGVGGVFLLVFLLLFSSRIFRALRTCFKLLSLSRIRRWNARGILEI